MSRNERKKNLQRVLVSLAQIYTMSDLCLTGDHLIQVWLCSVSCAHGEIETVQKKPAFTAALTINAI